MKPLIQRVYIDKNRNYPYLTQIIRTEYGLEPTYVPTIALVVSHIYCLVWNTDDTDRKRQFSLNVKEWGFRENVSGSERRKVLQGVERGADDLLPVLTDRRIGAGIGGIGER